MPPLNDNFADATVLDPAGGSLAGTTIAATQETDEPVYDGMGGLERNSMAYTFGSVWYKLTAAADGAWGFDPGATAAGLEIAVYKGTTLADLELVAYNANSEAFAAAFAGETLYVQLYTRSDGDTPQPFTLAWEVSPRLLIDVKVDGTAYGPFLYGARSFGGQPVPSDHIRALWFGGFYEGGVNDRQIRNITVGTTGYGSSDLFAPALTDLSEFDSIQGASGDISAAGGVLTVSGSGADVWAAKDLGADFASPVYVRMELKLGATDAAETFVNDFHAIASSQVDAGWIDSEYGYSGAWWLEEPDTSTGFSSGPVADTWVTFDFRWDFGFVTSAPVADFTGAPALGVAPLSVSFTDLSTGSPTSWAWDFGDGSTSTAQNPSHTYAAGVYTVTLVATNAAGSSTKVRRTYITAAAASPSDCASAINLTPFCSQAIIDNSAAADTPEADDPLEQVYERFGPFERQQWFKLKNTTGERKYARFILHNPTGAAYGVAAALYTDCPATGDLTLSDWFSVGADSVVREQSIAAGADAGVDLGYELQPGETVYLELASESSGSEWNGQLLLTWNLLDIATFHDTIDGGSAVVDGAAWVGPRRSPRTTGAVEVLSYCRRGGDDFAACLNEGVFEVNVWSGGSLTTYTIGNFGTAVGDYNLLAPQIRTDGTDLWLVAYQKNTLSNPHWSGHTWTVWQPDVLIWNGSGFTSIAQGTATTLNGSGDGGNAEPFLGPLAACASPSEPGVFYFAWTEGGAQKQSALTGGSPYGTHMQICKCSTSALLSTLDLFDHTTGVATGAGGYNVHFETYAQPVVTGFIFLTNGRGSPLLFVNLPTGYVTDFADITATVGEVLMIDVNASSTESADVLQTITGTDYDAAATKLLGNVSAGGSFFPTTLGGVEVVYVTAPFSSSYSFSDIIPRLLVGPADGSASFTTADAGAVTTFNPIALEIIDEGDGSNIWAGAGFFNSASAISQWHRSGASSDAWAEFFDSSLTLLATVEGPQFALEGDTIYVPGRTVLPDRKKVGILALSILRDYIPSALGDCALPGSGAFAWYRSSLRR